MLLPIDREGNLLLDHRRGILPGRAILITPVGQRLVEVLVRDAIAALESAQDVRLGAQVPELEDVPVAQGGALALGQLETSEIGLRIRGKQLAVGSRVELG